MPEPIVWNTVRLAIYGSSMFGSVIPTILVNTPGTPVNALITCDGFPMTQGGEARRVLGHACFGQGRALVPRVPDPARAAAWHRAGRPDAPGRGLLAFVLSFVTGEGGEVGAASGFDGCGCSDLHRLWRDRAPAS